MTFDLILHIIKLNSKKRMSTLIYRKTRFELNFLDDSEFDERFVGIYKCYLRIIIQIMNINLCRSIECSGKFRTHFRTLVNTTHSVTRIAPEMDQPSGISLNNHSCHTKASAISVAARTTDTGPAASNCSERVNSNWPKKLNTPRHTISDHSPFEVGHENPSKHAVMITVSISATQPKLNMITEWCADFALRTTM